MKAFFKKSKLIDCLRNNPLYVAAYRISYLFSVIRQEFKPIISALKRVRQEDFY